MLIDEYDNFANTVLAHRGREAYESFTHGGGFYRNFFAALKAGTGEAGGLERLFITSVSPITMADGTSGFNTGRNVTLKPEFNEVLGFTEAEVRGLLELYRERGAFSQDVDAALDVMREWYNGYRFAKTATGDLYNTGMVLHYPAESVPNKPMPDDLIDPNVRIDYTNGELLVEGREVERTAPFPGGEAAQQVLDHAGMGEQVLVGSVVHGNTIAPERSRVRRPRARKPQGTGSRFVRRDPAWAGRSIRLPSRTGGVPRAGP